MRVGYLVWTPRQIRVLTQPHRVYSVIRDDVFSSPPLPGFKTLAGETHILKKICWHHLDLTTVEGLLNILEYETLNERGHIRRVWMEYLIRQAE